MLLVEHLPLGTPAHEGVGTIVGAVLERHPLGLGVLRAAEEVEADGDLDTHLGFEVVLHTLHPQDRPALIDGLLVTLPDLVQLHEAVARHRVRAHIVGVATCQTRLEGHDLLIGIIGEVCEHSLHGIRPEHRDEETEVAESEQPQEPHAAITRPGAQHTEHHGEDARNDHDVDDLQTGELDAVRVLHVRDCRSAPTGFESPSGTILGHGSPG